MGGREGEGGLANAKKFVSLCSLKRGDISGGVVVGVGFPLAERRWNYLEIFRVCYLTARERVRSKNMRAISKESLILAQGER